MKRAIAHSLILTLITGVLLSLLSECLLRPILTWMNTPADIYDHAYRYIRIIFGGMLVTMLYNMLAGFLRSVGDSRTPFYVLIVASLLNIALDLLFMGPLHFGVSGAAIATLISQGVSVMLCLIFILWKYRILLPQRVHCRLNAFLVRELLGNGFSLGIQGSFIAVGSILVQTALNALGTVYVAANTAANKVSQLFMQPLATLGSTMSTFSSQNLGAGQLNRVKAGLRCANLISTVWSLLSFLCSLLFGPALINLLVSASSDMAAMVVQEGTVYLRIHLLFFLFLGPLFIYRNTLQGIGNKLTPLFSGILELIVKFITAFWLAPAFGYIGIVSCEPIAWVLCMLLLLISFYRDSRVKALSKAWACFVFNLFNLSPGIFYCN